MKFFVCGAICSKGTENVHLVSNGLANNEEECIGNVYKYLEKNYPSEGGWRDYFITVKYISKKDLLKYVEKLTD